MYMRFLRSSFALEGKESPFNRLEGADGKWRVPSIYMYFVQYLITGHSLAGG